MRADSRDVRREGWIYLIHFDEPYRHARHYLGFVDAPDPQDTEAVQHRLMEHQTGRGARLMAVVVAACVPWRLVMTRRGTRADERRLKAHSSGRLCPICGPEHRANERAAHRSRGA